MFNIPNSHLTGWTSLSKHFTDKKNELHVHCSFPSPRATSNTTFKTPFRVWKWTLFPNTPLCASPKFQLTHTACVKLALSFTRYHLVGRHGDIGAVGKEILNLLLGISNERPCMKWFACWEVISLEPMWGRNHRKSVRVTMPRHARTPLG